MAIIARSVGTSITASLRVMATAAQVALARPASYYVRPGLSTEEVEEIREAFKLFDSDDSGLIDPRELKEAMLSLGLGARNSTVTAMIAQIDSATEGRIDFEQFLDLMTAKAVRLLGRVGGCAEAVVGVCWGRMPAALDGRVTQVLAPHSSPIMQADRDSREEINKVFRLFDVDNKGYLTIRDLSKVARELGESLTGARVRAAWPCACCLRPLQRAYTCGHPYPTSQTARCKR